MQRRLFLYLTIGVMWTVNGDEPNCDHLGTLLYEDLGCRPYYDDGSLCPTRFSCNSFQTNKNACLFRGKKYTLNQKVSDHFIAENCFLDCKCVNPSGYNKYECGIMNCTDWNEDFNSTSCYKQYVLDQCCSIGTACPGDGRQIQECLFEGTRYREGELFYPSNTCSKCSCRRGFRGIVEDPYCKRSLCATQLINHEELENYCAPLYLPPPGQTALCCPDEWVCHSENDTIAAIVPNADPDTDRFCNFGPKMVRVGEGFTRLYDYFGMDVQVKCECMIPPLLTCRPS